MNWRPKNIRETMCPILVLNWLTGLGLNDYPVGNRRNKLFLIGVIVIAGVFWMSSISFELLSCWMSNRASVTLRRIMLFLDTLIATFAMLHGWFHRKKMYQLTESMEALDDIFNYLGFRKNYYKSFKQVLSWTFVYLILIGTSYVYNLYLWMISNHDKSKQSVHLCCFIISWPYYTTIVVDISFHFTLKFIEMKLKLLNSLQFTNYNKNSKSSFFDNEQINHGLFISNVSNDFQLKKSIEKVRKHLEIIKHIYLVLYNQSQEINDIYGKNLLLQMISSFYAMTLWSYSLVLYYYKNKYIVIVYIMLKIILAFLRLLHINIPCYNINKETEKLKDILTVMKQPKKNLLIKEEMDHIYQQICLLPLTFSTYRFNTLGIDFMFEFLANVTAYVFILVQFQVN